MSKEKLSFHQRMATRAKSKKEYDEHKKKYMDKHWPGGIEEVKDAESEITMKSIFQYLVFLGVVFFLLYVVIGGVNF